MGNEVSCNWSVSFLPRRARVRFYIGPGFFSYRKNILSSTYGGLLCKNSDNLLSSLFIELMRFVMRKLWRLWAQALGEKSGESDSEADAIARFRTLLILQGVITNILISINILISWLK